MSIRRSARDRHADRVATSLILGLNSWEVVRDWILERAYILYREEVAMRTSCQPYVGINVSKDFLDVATLDEARVEQYANDRSGSLVCVSRCGHASPS